MKKLNLLTLLLALIIILILILLFYIYPLARNFPLASMLFILFTVAVFSIVTGIVKLLTNFLLALIHDKLEESAYKFLVALSPLSNCAIAIILCEQYHIPLDYFINLIHL